MRFGIRCGDRVLTRFGFGKLSESHGESYTATLERPFACSAFLSGRPGEIIRVWDSVLVRVVNFNGLLLTNAAVLPREVALVQWESPCPPDETRFLIDSRRGTFEQSQLFGPLVNSRYVKIASWVDRWGRAFPNEVEIKLHAEETIEEWIESFHYSMHSTSCGIAYFAVLDRKEQKLMWHTFLCESGPALFEAAVPSGEPA